MARISTKGFQNPIASPRQQTTITRGAYQVAASSRGPGRPIPAVGHEVQKELDYGATVGGNIR